MNFPLHSILDYYGDCMPWQANLRKGKVQHVQVGKGGGSVFKDVRVQASTSKAPDRRRAGLGGFKFGHHGGEAENVTTHFHEELSLCPSVPLEKKMITPQETVPVWMVSCAMIPTCRRQSNGKIQVRIDILGLSRSDITLKWCRRRRKCPGCWVRRRSFIACPPAGCLRGRSASEYSSGDNHGCSCETRSWEQNKSIASYPRPEVERRLGSIRALPSSGHYFSGPSPD